MTDTSVSQSVVYVSSSAAAQDTSVSQTAVYVSSSAAAQDTSVSQSVIYVSGEVASESSVSQATMYVSGEDFPCLAHMAQCWKITRSDGVVHAYTSHDEDVVFRGVVYKSCGSIQSSAYQTSGEVGDSGNAALTGLLGLFDGDTGISDIDISTGKLDSASVEIWDVPWGETLEEGTVIPFPLLKGAVGKISLKDTAYELEVVTLSGLINQNQLLESYVAPCRWMLGDAGCKVNLSGYTQTGVVTGLTPTNVRGQLRERQFYTTGLMGGDEYFQNGKLTWTSGNNAGYSSEVAGNVGNGVSLWNVMPHAIEVGDEFTIVAGCDKTTAQCGAKFNNIINFGGFPHIPGMDVMLQTPDSRA